MAIPNLGDPTVPAVDELLHTHTAVSGGVEDHEEVRDLLAVEVVGLALLILEESRAESCELVDVDGLVTLNIEIVFNQFSKEDCVKLDCRGEKRREMSKEEKKVLPIKVKGLEAGFHFMREVCYLFN